MRLPRDLSGRDLAGRLARHYGYTLRRMSGSHMTVARVTDAGRHSVTVPAPQASRGTLNSIVNESGGGRRPAPAGHEANALRMTA